MRFWDASALVPIISVEASTPVVLTLLGEDKDLVTTPSVLIVFGPPIHFNLRLP